MSADIWKTNMDLCRCCHTEGKFKNLSKTIQYLGETENYVEILKDCFDINLEPISGSLYESTYAICEPCTIRLRDAHQFKKQVLECEEKFMELVNTQRFALGGSAKIDVCVKTETPDTVLEDNLHDNDFEDELDWKYLEGDKKPVKKEDSSKKKIKKTKDKHKSVKTKSCKESRPKEKDESQKDEEKKKGSVQKFHLKDGDYTKEGDAFICTHCKKKYEKICSLKYHIRVKHYQIPRYACPSCDKEFMTPAPLAIHKLEVHNIDDRFKCNACKGVFNTKVQLRKHKNNFHMLGEKLKCDLCEYESFSFEGMYKHKVKHKTVKDYHCRFCRKSFLRKTTLDLHERIHTGDRRKVCSVCGQAFVQKASLNYHMTKYHPEVNF